MLARPGSMCRRLLSSRRVFLRAWRFEEVRVFTARARKADHVRIDQIGFGKRDIWRTCGHSTQ